LFVLAPQLESTTCDPTAKFDVREAGVVPVSERAPVAAAAVGENTNDCPAAPPALTVIWSPTPTASGKELTLNDVGEVPLVSAVVRVAAHLTEAVRGVCTF
jgi:hypothetical protein